jgi:predicted  nucleic acid-binding Zn-ribbon protein
MDTVLDILSSVLLFGGIALIVVLIIVLFRLKNGIDQLIAEVRHIRTKSEPILDKVEAVASKTEEVLEMLTENREALTETTAYLRNTAANIYRLEQMLQEHIEPTLLFVVRKISGVRKGIEAFFAALRR